MKAVSQKGCKTDFHSFLPSLAFDYLREQGQSRYIITDDEFAQPRRLASFARRVLDLDSSVIAHFGAPLDVLGRPVSPDAGERRAEALERRRYVCDRDGEVQWDEQRDRVYTDRLGEALVDAFPRYAAVLSTHATAYAAWSCLADNVGSSDPFRLVRVPTGRRRLRREQLLQRLASTLERVHDGVRRGRWGEALPKDAGRTLQTALDHFERYHRSRVLARRGSDLVIEDPRLCLYYRNRLTFLDRPERSQPLGGAS